VLHQDAPDRGTGTVIEDRHKVPVKVKVLRSKGRLPRVAGEGQQATNQEVVNFNDVCGRRRIQFARRA